MKDKEKPLKVLPMLKKPIIQNKMTKPGDKEKNPDSEQIKKSSADCEKKQQMLSALLNESNIEQPQSTSGLLNLNRQQQEILSNSKQQPPPQPPRVQPQDQQRKMEAARKEYEDAMMNVLQQRKLELSEPTHYHGLLFYLKV